jgi:putative sterol carrier protein
MDKPTTAAEMMRGLPEAFLPDKAGSTKAVIQLNLTGEGGGNWIVDVADGKCQVSEGTATSPRATITAGAADYLAIGLGQLNAVSAFMAGKVKVTGDMALVMSFQNWFAKP